MCQTSGRDENDGNSHVNQFRWGGGKTFLGRAVALPLLPIRMVIMCLTVIQMRNDLYL